jgi:hypothetical protein
VPENRRYGTFPEFFEKIAVMIPRMCILVRFGRGDFSFEMVLTLGEASYHKKFRVKISKIGQDTEVRTQKFIRVIMGFRQNRHG